MKSGLSILSTKISFMERLQDTTPLNNPVHSKMPVVLYVLNRCVFNVYSTNFNLCSKRKINVIYLPWFPHHLTDQCKFLRMASQSLSWSGLCLNSQPHFLPQTVWCLMLLKLLLLLQNLTIFVPVFFFMYAPSSVYKTVIPLSNSGSEISGTSSLHFSHEEFIFSAQLLLQLVYTFHYCIYHMNIEISLTMSLYPHWTMSIYYVCVFKV